MRTALNERSGFLEWLDRVAGGTEMGRMVCDFDWASTPLGSPDTWPLALRTSVGVCLTSRFPMLIVWGPDLVKIYNDGYRSMLGSTKHPGALGSPAREVWPEIWDTVGPLFEAVLTTAEPTWEESQMLLIERNGFAEECWFTYSYSPLFDDDGSVGGVLDVARETTDHVLARRRLEALADLTAELVIAPQVTDVCRIAISVLSRWSVDIEAAELYLDVDGRLALIASNRRPGWAPAPTSVLESALEQRRSITIGDADDGSRPISHCVLPIEGGFDSVSGVLALALNERRPFDADYRRYVELISQVIATALDSAYRRTVEVGEYRRISEALQASMLEPVSNFPTVAARYRPAEGNLAVGGDWYDIIDLGGDRRAIVVGDCVGHGLQAATVMAQLRSASRAMLLEGYSPAETLEALDSFASAVDGAKCATAVCAIIDRRRNEISYSRAGHPPPLLVADGRVEWLDEGQGVPLGLGIEDARQDAVQRLAPDSALLFYTDGLVERAGESLDVGLARLAEAAAEAHGELRVQQLADRLLAQLVPEGVSDDVVLVAKVLPSKELSED